MPGSEPEWWISTQFGVLVPYPCRVPRRTSPLVDQSQVFADTERVDLFNDPRWEAWVGQEQIQVRRLCLTSVPVVRNLVRKGRHSRKAA